MRLFVAIEVPSSLGATGEGPGTRAVEHVTLRFLGELPEEGIAELTAALGRVADSAAPFDLLLDGVGAFPSRSRPRVVFLGARSGSGEAVELASRVSAAVAPIAPRDARERFVPHLTLFRVRSPADRARAHDLLEGRSPAAPARSVHVDRIALVASTLTPRGAVHRTVAEFPLRGPSVARS